MTTSGTRLRQADAASPQRLRLLPVFGELPFQSLEYGPAFIEAGSHTCIGATAQVGVMGCAKVLEGPVLKKLLQPGDEGTLVSTATINETKKANEAQKERKRE
jgi:Cys-tRNA synthase (O-phospho-L-seryl-tRNA:Cys-tRNA synthase)